MNDINSMVEKLFEKRVEDFRNKGYQDWFPCLTQVKGYRKRVVVIISVPAVTEAERMSRHYRVAPYHDEIYIVTKDGHTLIHEERNATANAFPIKIVKVKKKRVILKQKRFYEFGGMKNEKWEIPFPSH